MRTGNGGGVGLKSDLKLYPGMVTVPSHSNYGIIKRIFLISSIKTTNSFSQCIHITCKGQKF